MTIQELLKKIKTGTEEIDFDLVIKTIAENYNFTPSGFTNGIGDEKVVNEAGTNEGSCKIFSFASLNKLSKEETLQCFGKYYRDDVLKHPEKSDHSNIRAFIIHGWDGINFDQPALSIKKPE